MSNVSRFLNLEIGEDRQEFNTPAEAKLHVAKQLENLSGLKGDAKLRQSVIDEVAAGYDFTPPPMWLEKKNRELRHKMWQEEDRKKALAEGRTFKVKPYRPWVDDAKRFKHRVKKLIGL